MKNKSISLMIFAGISFSEMSIAGGNQPTSDNNSYVGDKLQMRMTVKDFKEKDAAAGASKKCATVDSDFRVTYESDSDYYGYFSDIINKSGLIFGTQESTNECKEENRVTNDEIYKIDKSELQKYAFTRSGISFGGLAVPFKFFLGGDKSINTSATVAPYLGYRIGINWNQITLTPIVSAGLGLVPITDRVSSESSTRAALSVSFGAILTSAKNEAFNAGFLIGRDLLNHKENDVDPVANKSWISIFIGFQP